MNVGKKGCPVKKIVSLCSASHKVSDTVSLKELGDDLLQQCSNEATPFSAISKAENGNKGPRRIT